MKSEKEIRREHELLFSSMKQICENLNNARYERASPLTRGEILNIEHLARAAVKRVTESTGPR